jgi:hypothetical protein
MKSNIKQISSSQLIDQLIDNTGIYSDLLINEAEQLSNLIPDDGLIEMFKKMSTQTISIYPMALCDLMLRDIGLNCPASLLTGIGLSMFQISTHDDVVDEMHSDRQLVANLVYTGNITNGYGISLLLKNRHNKEALILLDLINKNHLYQTQIISKLWNGPTDEKSYLDAIITTRSWAYIGLCLATTYANRDDLIPFSKEFSDDFGIICQLFDDIREIEHDYKTGYYSLPISFALNNDLDLESGSDINRCINQSKKLASKHIDNAKRLTDSKYQGLYSLVNKIETFGSSLCYGDNFSLNK